MKTFKATIAKSIAIVLVVAIGSLLLFVLRNTSEVAIGSMAYPPPNEKIINETESKGSDPGQQSLTIYPYKTPQPTFTLESGALLATQYVIKYGEPMPVDVASTATAAALTPKGSISKAYFPVRSLADIPRAVLNDPFYGNVNQPDFGVCLETNQPGQAVFIHSLEKGLPDFYLLPFFRDTRLCGVFMITVQEGMGTVDGWSGARGDRYPAVSAAEAGELVEKKTGKMVVGTPQLVFRSLLEAKSPFHPFWEAKTEDGEVYYVIFIVGVDESNQEVLTVNMYSISEVHPIEN